MNNENLTNAKVKRVRKSGFRLFNIGSRSRIITIISIIIVIGVSLLILFLIDNYRMNNNMKVLFSTWGKKYTPSILKPAPYNSYTIIDRTKVCDEALEYIGSDAQYDYYLPCIMSETVFIKYDNGWEETLKYALEENHITIESLLNHNFNLYKEDKISEQSNRCNTSDFEVNIFSDKKSYKTTDKIRLWATLKYIGSKDIVEIFHGGGYMLFYITNGKDFNLNPAITLQLASSKLEKNKLYYYDFQKTGGWSADDPNAEFWEAFYNEKDLYLPADEYIIKIRGAFSLTADMVDVDLECDLKIKVEE